MYSDEIKRILQATYGVNASTLDVGSSAERGSKLYFYTLDGEFTDEIASVRDALNRQLSKNTIGRLIELTQFLPGNKWDLPQCARLAENNGRWTLTFHFVKGVRYHRSFGNHIASTLILQNTPVITLSSEKKDTFYGYWDKTVCVRSGQDAVEQVTTDGMNYRINRNLLSNSQFRAFTAAFFSAAAETEKMYILKDIGRTIKKCGCFLPSIPFSSVIQSHTPKEIIDASVPEPGVLNLNYNKIDLNTGYAIASLAPAVSRRDRPALIGISMDLFAKCFTLKNAFDGFNSFESVGSFIVNYYRHVRGFSEKELDDYVKDYVAMCLDTNTPVKLRCSLKKLIEAHDELSRAVRKNRLEAAGSESLVMTPSRFDNLEKSLSFLYPNELQRIITSEQLLAEGETQHNCVYSRKALIQSDRAAIFHWSFENAGHTVQFSADRRGRYYLDEVKARFNAECSQSAITRLREMLAAANTCQWIEPEE